MKELLRTNDVVKLSWLRALLSDAGIMTLVLDNNTASIRRYNGKIGEYMGVFSNLRNAGMNSPKFMEYGPEGDIFVAGNGSAGATIQRIYHATGEALGSFIKPGAGGLSAAQGLLFHTDGLLYVSDGRSHNVLRYDGQSGEFVDEFVSPGSGGLSNPHSLRFGPHGHLYIASRNTDSVKRYDGQTGESLGEFVAAGTDGMDQPTGLLFAEVCTPCDTNCDGSVDLTDVEPFINLLLNGGEPCGACSGDVNNDGSVDLTDVEGFIGCLLG